MGTGLHTETEIQIDAPIQRVWEGITNPDLIKQWFFGVDTETDWRVGGPLVHRGEYQGHPYVDRGTVIAFEPPRRLVHTHWSDVSGLPDDPTNYQRVTWSLRETGDRTRLIVGEDNLPTEDAKRTSEQGWQAALDALADLLGPA